MNEVAAATTQRVLTEARSFLFVPGDRPERFAKALASGADVVILDLEDAVALPAKAAARAAVAQGLAALGPADKARTVVRINDAAAPGHADDLAMLAAAHAGAVMLPKAERAPTIAGLIGACPGIVVLPLVESARGVLAAEALAAAPGVVRLVFGTLDFALDLGIELADDAGPEGADAAPAAHHAHAGFAPHLVHAALDPAASRIALASRAAGIAPPVAGVTPAIDDETQLRADFARARAHGYTAKLCIHPRQVAPVHAMLAPSAAQLEHARRVLQAAEAAGGAAVQLDGRMVDKPVIERARRIVQRAAR